MILWLGDTSHTSKSEHGGLPHVGRPILLNEYIRRYRSHIQAVFLQPQVEEWLIDYDWVRALAVQMHQGFN
jgi:hypothetical protein